MSTPEINTSRVHVERRIGVHDRGFLGVALLRLMRFHGVEFFFNPIKPSSAHVSLLSGSEWSQMVREAPPDATIFSIRQHMWLHNVRKGIAKRSGHDSDTQARVSSITTSPDGSHLLLMLQGEQVHGDRSHLHRMKHILQSTPVEKNDRLPHVTLGEITGMLDPEFVDLTTKLLGGASFTLEPIKAKCPTLNSGTVADSFTSPAAVVPASQEDIAS